MFYQILADILVVLHMAFILFVVFGALLTLRWRWMPLVHLPAVGWGAYIEFFNVICPLTPLELRLRALAGEDGYSDGFIEHYLLPIIYPPGLQPGHQVILGILAVIVNMALYAYVIFRRRRRRIGMQ